MEEIFKVNGQTSDKKKWFRLNRKQVLEQKGDKSRIIYPYKIEDEVIKSNIFLSGSWGNLAWVLLFTLGLLFILWNYNINMSECIDVMENPKDFCSDYEDSLNGGGYGFGEGFKTDGIIIDGG